MTKLFKEIITLDFR